MAQELTQAMIDADPEIQAILRQPSSFGSIGSKDAAVRQYLAGKGISIPDGYQISPTGKLEEQQTFVQGLEKYGPIAAAGALGPLAIGALGGGAGAATIADPGIGAAGVPASIAAPAATTAAVTGGTSLWHALANPAVIGAGISAGAGLGGALIQAGAQKDATAAQLQAAREAEQFLKQKYAQTQQQVAPYIASGQGALSALDTGLGITPTPPQGAGAQLPPLNTSIPVPASRQGVTFNWQNPSASTSAAAPVTPTATSVAPAMNLASLGQTAQTASGVQPAWVGEQRLINGQPAQFDGTGWLAIGAA